MTPPDDVSTKLQKIRERVEAATEGPWYAEDAFGGEPFEKVITTEDWTLAASDKGNARFIAAARSDVPWLLSRLEEVVDLLDGWERAYPTDIFPEPPERPDKARLVWVDPETGEQLSETFALGRVSAAMGRFMATALRRALRDAAQEGAE